MLTSYVIVDKVRLITRILNVEILQVCFHYLSARRISIHSGFLLFTAVESIVPHVLLTMPICLMFWDLLLEIICTAVLYLMEVPLYTSAMIDGIIDSPFIAILFLFENLIECSCSR